ncbi:MAG: hypothetical protein WCR08_00925 [Gammaproteobacteria bacterium]
MEGSVETRTAVRAALTKGAGNMALEALGETTSVLESLSGSSASAVVATVAIGATVEALKLGYDSIVAHAQASQDAYSLFVQDYNAGTVSVFLPTDQSVRSTREKFFDTFIQLFQSRDGGRNSPLFRYAGIRYTESAEISIPSSIPMMGATKRQGTRYSLISMSALVFAGPYEYARSGDPLLDIALRGSDLFLRAKLSHSLAAIFNYGSPNIFASMTEHAVTTGQLSPKVLRHLDLVRFMMLAFANLLINLQHPGDLDAATNIPLHDEGAIALCGTVIDLINQILLPKKSDKKFAYLHEIYCKDEFLQFIRLVKREAEELQEGYQSKKLKQLNLVEVIAQSHGILQVLSRLWHQMLYLDKPMTEPTQLLYLVRSLSNALDDHPKFWNELAASYTQKKKGILPVIAGLNQPYTTVIDLIGLFASISKEQRTLMLSKIEKNKIAPAVWYALNQLGQIFIEPMTDALSIMQDNAADAFLMNLIAISIEGHPSFLQEAVVPVAGIPTLQQQFSVINNAQIETKELPVKFTWRLLDYLTGQSDSVVSISKSPIKKGKQKNLTVQTGARIKALLKAEYEFLDALRSISALQELLESNRNLLLRKNVRDMLRKVLSFLSIKEGALSHAIEKLIEQITTLDKIDDEEKDEISNQRRQFIVQMRAEKQGLMGRVQLVKREIESAIEILDSPAFVKALETEIREEVNAVYASHEDFLIAKEQLIAELRLPVLRQIAVPSSSAILSDGRQESISRIPLDTASSISQESAHDLHDVRLEDDNLEATPNQALRLQFILRILRLASAFLLIVGLLVLVSMTLGASYLPVVAALSPQQLTVGMAVGGMSALVGGAGLGFSCFFKPAVAQGASSEVAGLSLIGSVF